MAVQRNRMSDDQQSLLAVNDGSYSDNDGRDDDIRIGKKALIKRLFNWRQWFSRRNDAHLEKNDREQVVSVLQMFRFADHIDLFLMAFVMFISVLEACFFVGGMILFGKISGIFAMLSFDNTCYHQQQNRTEVTVHNMTCPLGINLDSINFNHLYRLCQHNPMGTMSSVFAASILSFREKVMPLVYRLLIASAGQFICVTIGTYLWLITVRRQTARINIHLFRSLLQRNISFFDTTPTSQFNAQLFSSINTIQLGLGVEFKIFSVTICCITVSSIVSFFMNWKLSLIIICIIPLIYGASFIFSKIMAIETTNELNAQSKVGKIVEEVFSSIRTVLSFNGIRYEQKRYEKELGDSRWSTVRKGAVYGLYIGWLFFVTYIIYSVGFIFGSIFIESDSETEFDISDILVTISVFAICTDFLASISAFHQAFSEGRAAAAAVFRVIDEADDPTINEKDLWTEGHQPSITEFTSDINGDIAFDEAAFVYPSRQLAPVLNRLSLVARAGKTTALVGSSGCGKSTCISLLLRQYDLSTGEITINGRPINNFNLKQLRQNIGVVSQEPILFNLSIYENIRYGKVNATRVEIEEAAKQANAHNFIMQLPNKYETLVGEGGAQLSGGEKQRIALARALVKQPAILLLDEATSALDNVSEKIVQEALDRACKNRTTIVIAHRLKTIQNADQIYVLDKGSVCEEGTHETLMNKEDGNYQAMVRKQQLETLDKTEVNGEDVKASEESILQPTRMLSDTEIVDLSKENAIRPKQKSLFLRILSLNKPERKIILLGCIICALNGSIQTLFVFLLAEIISAFDSCGSSRISRQVVLLSCFLLLVGLLVLLLRFIQYTIFAFTGSKLAERIRVKTFACLLRQETAYFDQPENSSGAITLHLSSDAAALEQIVGTRLGVIFETIALTFFGVVFGIFFSWQLTLLVVFMLLFVLMINCINVYFGRTLRKQSDDILHGANTYAVELIHSMRTIKQLSVENDILARYSISIRQASKKFWKLDTLTSIIYGILFSIEHCFAAFLYWAALILVENNQLSLENIIIVFSFTIFTTHSLEIIGMLADRVGQSISAAQNFFDLFDRTPAIDNASTQGQELTALRGDIQFDQIKFIYPTRPTSVVLNNFHLSIKSGQRVALVGVSGSGKSTVVQLLERFYDVTKGRVLIDGVDIRELNIQWLRSRLGLVGQEPVLFDLSIAENITYGLENVPIEEIINAATKANIADLIHQLPQGYDTPVGVKGSFLSGGEKQRIAIARVLLRRPKILLLDEATSALDLHNEQIVQEALDQAQIEDAGRTSLIIAHRLSTIRSCDLICVVEGGRIVESGTHSELMEQGGIYYRMLAQQVT